MRSWLTLNWRAAFTFFAQERGWKRKLLLGGLWIAIFPPVGWLLALGYRKESVLRLIENQQPVLPEWTCVRRFFADGARAALVIMVYFLPYMLAFWTMAIATTPNPLGHAWEIALFFLVMPLCLPICMTGLPVLYLYLFPWMHLSNWQIGLLGVIFSATLFLMPAAFGQLSLHGNFRSALRLWNVIRSIRLTLRGYTEAWCIALLATAPALLFLPLAPWGIFLSYLIGSYAFNNALALSADEVCRQRFAASKAFAVASD